MEVSPLEREACLARLEGSLTPLQRRENALSRAIDRKLKMLMAYQTRTFEAAGAEEIGTSAEGCLEGELWEEGQDSEEPDRPGDSG